MNRMPRIVLFAIALLATVTDANAQDSPAEFLQTWAAACQESDTDKMTSFYDAAPETTVIESFGVIRRGPDGIREMYVRAFDEVHFDDIELTPIAESQMDSTAWVTCRYKAQTRLRTNDSRYVLEVYASFVMKKNEDGAWKITLEHFSPIADVPRVRPVDNEQ